MHPGTLGIGQPDENLGPQGVHVVALVRFEGRKWIVDGSVRQAYRQGRWNMPPEVVVAEVSGDLSTLKIDDYVELGFGPIARCDLPQGAGTSLRLPWLGKDDYNSPWENAPDAAQERATKISKRIEQAWQRS
ncbi:hypothetical protein [Methylobacterium soli]|uniref:Uncharacterized protein n=1 Tax=Methylobacterium soli TaxID=553447 RepID=A0A6L3T3L3_9HYPH|nr:hypothetical protein [Methylobacterium soli]KAB1080577.1 hypothetical protein F6X53_05135 [Methylobacterium soli]GJE42639.1 hypothetical protein AEGHOMDF_1811 [Methylobacterium soli]